MPGFCPERLLMQLHEKNWQTLNIWTVELCHRKPKLHKLKTCSGQSGGKSEYWGQRLADITDFLQPHILITPVLCPWKNTSFAPWSRRFPSPTDIDVFIRLNLYAASECLIICNGDSLGCLRYVVKLSAEREWEMGEWEGRLLIIQHCLESLLKG